MSLYQTHENHGGGEININATLEITLYQTMKKPIEAES